MKERLPRASSPTCRPWRQLFSSVPTVAPSHQVKILPRMLMAAAFTGKPPRFASAKQLAADPVALSLSKDRKSVVWGKSVSVRVDLGGRRIIKKKKRK